MKFGVECAVADPFGCRQRFVQDHAGAGDVARLGFGFGESGLDESVDGQNVLLAQKFGAPTHVREPAYEPAASSLGCALKKDPKCPPHLEVMVTRESGEFIGVLGSARYVALHQRE
jgi:hypothetical protein